MYIPKGELVYSKRGTCVCESGNLSIPNRVHSVFILPNVEGNSLTVFPTYTIIKGNQNMYVKQEIEKVC